MKRGVFNILPVGGSFREAFPIVGFCKLRWIPSQSSIALPSGEAGLCNNNKKGNNRSWKHRNKNYIVVENLGSDQKK